MTGVVGCLEEVITDHKDRKALANRVTVFAVSVETERKVRLSVES